MRELVLLRERLQATARKAAHYLGSLQITHPHNPAHGGFSRAMVKMEHHISGLCIVPAPPSLPHAPALPTAQINAAIRNITRPRRPRLLLYREACAAA